MGRQLSHKCATPINAISTLIEETLIEETLQRENSEKVTIDDTDSRSSPAAGSASPLILGFPDFGTVRNTFLLFRSCPDHGALLWPPEWTKCVI